MDKEMRLYREERKQFREDMKMLSSDVSGLGKTRWRVEAVLPEDGDDASPKPEIYDSISKLSAKKQHTDIESDSDSGNTDALRFIMDELKVLRKEMQETKNTVRDGIIQMKKHMQYTMNDVLERVAKNFEKQLTSIIEKVDRQNDSIEMIKDDVSSQAKCIESNNNKVNSVEAQLEESTKREKLAKTRLIHMDSNERRNNLMFFGVPEEDNTTTCEQSLQLHLKHRLKIETPCRVFNTKRVGLKRRDGPRPIVTSFADPMERNIVHGKRYNLSKPHGLSEDFPPEIRKARTMLVPEMKRLKTEGKKVGLKYPADLWVEDKLVRSIDIAEVKLD